VNTPRDTWRPTATRARLEQRASLLGRARRFFAARGVLEVDTPMLVNTAVTDVHIHSARAHLAVAAGSQVPDASHSYFLHTSPEYAMKRMLAAGSGDIFQICHVVRGLERGRLHNAEFTLIEWYRIGLRLDDLMSEVEALVRELLGVSGVRRAGERISYRAAFVRELGLDPFTAQLGELRSVAQQLGFTTAAAATSADSEQRDELLELLMAALVGPRLGRGALTFVHGYPATQAALARLDPHNPGTALRFELYCEGLELANGFHELASAAEQRARFEHDIEERRRRGLPTSPIDERLLAALAAGLPDCTGVALGFDRTLMLAAGATHIEEVLAFPTDRA